MFYPRSFLLLIPVFILHSAFIILHLFTGRYTVCGVRLAA